MEASPVTAERYRALRGLHDALTQRLHGSVVRRALDETATKLGLREQGRVVIDQQLERAIVLECALYDYAVSGTTAVARMAARPPEGLGDDQRMLLSAMRGARVTVFEVVGRTPPFGVTVHDLLGCDTFVLADLALSEAAEPGDLAMARLLRFDEFAMTTGVPLDAPRFALGLIKRAGALPATAWAPKPRAQIATNLYRLALSTEEQVKAQLASMALNGPDPLSLALRKALLTSTAMPAGGELAMARDRTRR